MNIAYDEPKVHLEIQMLGGFNVLAGGVPVLKKMERSKQVLNLLAYLLLNRRNVTSQERLIEILWADENSENPANALKNLVYRLRRVLSESEPLRGISCILHENGTYTWNMQVSCTIDAEEMESLWKQAGNARLQSDERIELLKQAISLYKGGFFADSGFEPWTVPMSAHYQTIYMSCVREALRLLMAEKRYAEVAAICEAAIALEPYEELLHESLLKAFVGLGKRNKALEHYNQISGKFYKELGVRLGSSIRNFYRDLVSSLNCVETDLCVIKGELSESDREGAFFCDYEIFRHLYRLEARSADRAGQGVFICLVTLSGHQHGVPPKELYHHGMEALKEVILQSLRKGDVVSRYSPTQYILMLPTLTFENGEMVMNRIVKRFQKNYGNPAVKIRATLEPVVSAV